MFFGAGRPAARRLGVRRLSALADGFALEIGIMLCLAAAGLLFFGISSLRDELRAKLM